MRLRINHSEDTPAPGDPAPAAPAAAPAPAAPTQRTVPYYEHQRALTRLADAEKAAGDLSGEVNTLRGQVAGFGQQRKAMETKHGEDLALVGTGITDVGGKAAARAIFDGLSKEKRGDSFAGWITGLKAEGAEVPGILQSYFQAPEPAPAAPRQPGGSTTSLRTTSPAAPSPANPPSDLEALNQKIHDARTNGGDWMSLIPGGLAGFGVGSS